MLTFKLIKGFTPGQAWEMFVPNGVELFLSFFHAEAAYSPNQKRPSTIARPSIPNLINIG